MLKGIEWPDQLGMKRKMRELQVNLPKRKENLLCIGSKFSLVFLGIFRYFYLFATQLHYLKMPKEKKNVGRDGEEA